MNNRKSRTKITPELIQKLKELANHHGYDIISIIRLREIEHCDDAE